VYVADFRCTRHTQKHNELQTALPIIANDATSSGQCAQEGVFLFGRAVTVQPQQCTGSTVSGVCQTPTLVSQSEVIVSLTDKKTAKCEVRTVRFCSMEFKDHCLMFKNPSIAGQQVFCTFGPFSELDRTF
jgi:hypothetical protein